LITHLPLAAQRADPTSPRLGTINFPTSGGPAAQPEFLKGVLYLHSFEYESAAQAFRRAQDAEPGFAMAYWGEAMTHTHPVWNEQNRAAARAALGRLAPTPEARRAKAGTPREQRYLDAVETLYGDGPKPRRDTLYAAAIERVAREYPEDLEAKAFYALALLGLSQGIRDTVTYLRAAPHADSVFHRNPDHPGAAHYLIHAFDDPFHAALGLNAARAYSKIAPDAAHAQHMTTHIFLAMGMWSDVVSQNEIAMALTRTLPGHYSSWLVYGMLQQGRYTAARELVELLRKNLETSGTGQQPTAMAWIRSHFVLHAEDWQGPVFRDRIASDRLTLPGRIADLYTDGVVAFRRRDTSALDTAANEIARLVTAAEADAGADDPSTQASRVMARALGGISLFLSGSKDAGVRALRAAAALEDGMPLDFGPPAIVEPTHELLGQVLLELDPRAAQLEFEAALRLAPGRSRALEGLVRASVAAGDKPRAMRALDQLAANWRVADSQPAAELDGLRRAVTRLP
jgi:tetratricopeptide (TPR) repeat protein